MAELLPTDSNNLAGVPSPMSGVNIDQEGDLKRDVGGGGLQSAQSGPSRVLTPPTSDDAGNRDEAEEEEEDEDIGVVEPAEWWDGGRIPIFRPTMRQFKDFQKFIEKIDKYGMKSGIVKVVPPPEWREMLPDLSEQIKGIRIKNPIKQEFAGTHGTYTQANIEKQRSYNLPQWKATTEESNHTPPASRGDRRSRAIVHTPLPKVEKKEVIKTPVSSATPGVKRGRGRPRKNPVPAEIVPSIENDQNIPPTPTSPEAKNDAEVQPEVEESILETPDVKEPVKMVEKQPETPIENETPVKRGRGRPPKASNSQKSTPSKTPKVKVKKEKKEKPDTITSVTSRRMNNRREQTYEIDENAFQEFDYHMKNLEQFTPERCKELEEHYWKTINYGTPMYGADMPGTLFDESLPCWNVAKLPNLLDVLGTKVPGVNTAYLYLGMWKATFAWHLEDVDLYSINYIHFGAPKQWYSISQEDARKFEAAMKSIWPNDAKHCDQFLRHKTYLISPEKLKAQFGITVNKLVHYEGEFVITYPYGYHSGFNLGYNCAESVNFANDTWLNYGRIAKKCHCESDSVWVDVWEIERKLRGEPTPEYLEYTDDEYDMDDLDRLPSPPPSGSARKRGRPAKRKRDDKATQEPDRKAKRVKIRVRVPGRTPCILCPNDPKYDVLLPTDNGKMAHRLCALYTPETYIVEENGFERVFNVAGIAKGRLELKCNYCRAKRGSVFQCSSRKCARAYHATCAAAGGVQIDIGMVPTWGEDGTEYYCEGYDFRCRFHRPKRSKHADSSTLEKNDMIMKYGAALKSKDVIQAMHLDGEAFGAMVLENRPGEQSCLIEVLPDGDVVELEWKWILVLEPEQSLRPKPSPEAKPLPQHLLKTEVSVTNRKDGVPEVGDPFHDPIAGQKWQEFHNATTAEIRNPISPKVDMYKSERVWHFIGKGSTDAKPQYTHDVRIKTHNPRSHFLDSVRPVAVPLVPRTTLPATYSPMSKFPVMAKQPSRPEKPYVYKPRVPIANMTQSQQLAAIYAANGLHWSQGLPGLAPRPPTGSPSNSNYAYANSRAMSNGAGHPTQNYRNPNSTPLSYTNQAHAAAQELLKKAIPPINTNHTSPSNILPQKFDNSPRHQDFYAQAESRYSSQVPKVYSQRYQALTQATQPAHENLLAHIAAPAMTPYHTQNLNSYAMQAHPQQYAYHDPALAGIKNGGLVELPQSPGLKKLPFTPPSQRPELRAAVNEILSLKTANGSTNNVGKTEPANLDPALASVGASKTAASASTIRPPLMHQTTEQFSSQLKSATPPTATNGAAGVMGYEKFEDLIRRLGGVGAQMQNLKSSNGNGAGEPSIDRSPERPGYSPISNAGGD